MVYAGVDFEGGIRIPIKLLRQIKWVDQYLSECPKHGGFSGIVWAGYDIEFVIEFKIDVIEWTYVRNLGIQNQWKPILWFVKGKFHQPDQLIGDVVSGGKEKDHHDWQQAESEAAHFIEALTDHDDLVYDPFIGGGTTAAVCKKLGRAWLACDTDEEAIRSSKVRLA